MRTTLSATEARARLSEIMDRLHDSRDAVTVTYRGKPTVVLVGAAEYARMIESARLLDGELPPATDADEPTMPQLNDQVL